jgi:hypothetical protein
MKFIEYQGITHDMKRRNTTKNVHDTKDKEQGHELQVNKRIPLIY